VAAGTGLTMSPASVNVDEDIVLLFTGGYHQGLPHHDGVFALGEVLGQILAVDADFPAAVPDIYPGNRSLSSAGSDTKILYHLFNLDVMGASKNSVSFYGTPAFARLKTAQMRF
jgi:hypothetical protein